METGRGKKGKKTGWYLTLGLKETIFAGIGVVGLMMMSFALGALAGRGDIYRAAYSWGLMSPAGPKVVQWAPGMEVPGGTTAAAPAVPGTATTPTNPVPVAAAPTPVPAPAVAAAPKAPSAVKAPAPVAAKHGKAGVVTGEIVPLSPPVATASAKKKGKTGTIHHDPKAKEEELRRVRHELVQKLKFQNSFDTAPKARLPKPKEHEKAQAKAGANSETTQVRVGQYRNGKAAQAKVTELHKKGIKATVRRTKDSKGTLYVVCKPGAAHHTDPEKLAKKPEKSSGIVKKPRIE